MNAPVMVELEGETDPLEVKSYNLLLTYAFNAGFQLDDSLGCLLSFFSSTCFVVCLDGNLLLK